ncbi:MAG: GFA family protein [Gammaproteobacteria bacterium]
MAKRMSACGKVIHGSCLCGAVALKITAPVVSMGHCHCRMCRKQHGTAFSTYCEVPASSLRIVKGANSIQRYASSDFAERAFCSRCGTKLTFTIKNMPKRIWVAAGALDDDPGVKPDHHIFVGSKAPWYEIYDDVPQFEAYPEDFG